MQIIIPTTCPCCDSLLETINEQLFCRNTACSAQLNKKLEHFCKTLGIKGMGPKTIEKLNLADITELFYLEKQETVEALGSEKVAVKLLDEIERAKLADLATVLASFSIPLIGDTASKKIASVVSHIDEINADKCKEAGLGNIATNNLLDWMASDYLDMKEFLPFTFKSQPSKKINTNGLIVCITGKLKSYKTKAEATKALIAAGYQVTESVTKTTNILIDEEDKASSKREKAEKYGITIVTNLTEFLKKETND